ncbi:MAG: SMP-30/gluconolactonase/LRE family protein, partial [Burkholderiales bacterium]
MRTIATGLRFPEGPIAMPDGTIVLVEIERQTLTRVRSDGGTEVIAKLGGGPNGAAIGPDGAAYVCNNGGLRWHEDKNGLRPVAQADDYSGGRIERVDLASGETRVLYRDGGNGPLRGPNDIVFDRAGGLWFTDLGKARARPRPRRRLLCGGRRFVDPRGHLPDADAQRHRALARRDAPVRG